jgi:hypothetical protein
MPRSYFCNQLILRPKTRLIAGAALITHRGFRFKAGDKKLSDQY